MSFQGLDPHTNRRTRTAREAFALDRGDEAARARGREIATLPRVDFKGRTLFTIRCQGLTGKGPHDVNVPEGLLWAVLDWRQWRCPYHT